MLMWNWISRACIPWPACTLSLYVYTVISMHPTHPIGKPSRFPLNGKRSRFSLTPSGIRTQTPRTQHALLYHIRCLLLDKKRVDIYSVCPDAAISHHLGNFWRTLGASFLCFIYCWALLGQKKLLVAIFGPSLFNQWHFLQNSGCFFIQKHLVALLFIHAGYEASWLLF